MKDFSHIIVRFNLRGEGIECETEMPDKIAGEIVPEHFGISRDMSVIIAGGAIEFAEVFELCRLFDLPLPAIDKYGEFFAHCGRGGGLTVRACEYREVFGVLCEL